jgi:hypothetical protein
VPFSPSSCGCSKLLQEMEARVGIESTHKGFAVMIVRSKLLTNMGVPVGRGAPKCSTCPVFSPYCQPNGSRAIGGYHYEKHYEVRASCYLREQLNWKISCPLTSGQQAKILRNSLFFIAYPGTFNQRNGQSQFASQREQRGFCVQLNE